MKKFINFLENVILTVMTISAVGLCIGWGLLIAELAIYSMVVMICSAIAATFCEIAKQ